MTWTFVAQVTVLAAALGLVVAITGGMLHGAIIDKRREDAHKRKESGL